MKDIRFPICAFFIAIATWAYQAQARCTFQPDLQTVSVLFAFLVLLRPSSVVLFLLLMLFQTASIYVDELPQHVNSNRILHFFIGLMVLVAGAPTLVRAIRDRRLDADEFFESFRPLVCLLLIIVYFFAVWHKLNYGFLNPDVSYAAHFYPGLQENLAFLVTLPPRESVETMVIYSTLIMETAIPLMLIFRPTRSLGILSGLLFHFGLSIAGFYAFTATMVALLCFFLPENLTERIERRINLARLVVGRNILILGMLVTSVIFVARRWDWDLIPRFADRVASVIAAAPEFLSNQAWFVNTVTFVAAANQAWVRESELTFWYFAWLYAIPILAYAVICLTGTCQHAQPRKLLFQFHPVFAILPVVVLLNGFCPYLGLKNYYSFEMFSNLHLEDGRTNHLIFRRYVSLADYQSDVVRIIDSSNEDLRAHAEDGALVATIDLRRRIGELRDSGHRNISITFVQNGVEQTVKAAESDPLFAKPLNYWERKFVIVKPIYPAKQTDSGAAPDGRRR